MNKILIGSLLLSLFLMMGCTTKKYVNQQVVPIIDKVNALDQRTATNTHDLAQVNETTQQAISSLTDRTVGVDQRAIAEGQRANEADQVSRGVSARTESVVNTIKNMDSYQNIGDVAIQFPAEGDQLDQQAAKMINDFAARVPSAGDYVLTLKGNTDALGPQEYNYELSKRRAMAVAGYLASKLHIPPYRLFFVGLGPDQPVAENKTKSGRARNRRVDIGLFTNAPPSRADEEPAQSAAIK
jgi:OmpA-OmpF porin, OOP family